MHKFMVIFKMSIVYVFDTLRAGLFVAYEVLTLKQMSHPRVVVYEPKLQSDMALTIFAHLITFSPGTMVVGLSKDKKKMLIHMMLDKGEEEVLEAIRDRIETPLLEVMR